MARRLPAAAAARVDLIRVMDLLQTHVTSALCQTVFRRIRTTERQRAWTLQALAQFWIPATNMAKGIVPHAEPSAICERGLMNWEGRDYMRDEPSLKGLEGL